MRICLSYRPAESAGWHTVIKRKLERYFGAASIVDGASLAAQTEPDAMVEQVSRCDALVAIIGPNWAQGMSAVDGAVADPVQLQIGAAARPRPRIFCILVGGMKMPDERSLPPEVR